MQTLLAISLVLGFVSLVLTFVTHVAVCRAWGRRPKARDWPGISVLKPLKGVDDGLYDNLASFARQNYPEFELLLGCEDPADPALRVAWKLKRAFPKVRIRILAGAASHGQNPKVNNLRMLSARAEHDCILISDASIRARPGYLRAMASELGEAKVGLVSSVLVGAGERTLGARLDNLHMNSFVVRAVCGAAVLTSRPCVVGKSMLMKKSELEALGGFALVDDVLAEDYVLGERYAAAGFGVALSAYALDSVSARRSVRDFCARHVRWSQMRRQLSPGIYLLEPLQSPLPFLLAALVLLAGGAAPSLAEWLVPWVVAGLALRLCSDGLLGRKLRGARLCARDYIAILFKDLLCIGVWLVGAFKRTVDWRGTAMRIGPGSRLFPLEQHQAHGPALERA
jgi:ceramide glucosyltransferase